MAQVFWASPNPNCPPALLAHAVEPALGAQDDSHLGPRANQWDGDRGKRPEVLSTRQSNGHRCASKCLVKPDRLWELCMNLTGKHIAITLLGTTPFRIPLSFLRRFKEAGQAVGKPVHKTRAELPTLHCSRVRSPRAGWSAPPSTESCPAENDHVNFLHAHPPRSSNRAKRVLCSQTRMHSPRELYFALPTSSGRSNGACRRTAGIPGSSVPRRGKRRQGGRES